MAEAVLAGDIDAVQAAIRERHRRDWLGYLAISLGTFMALLDIQIVASSINQIQAGLLASRDEIQWVQTAYLIAEVIAVPLSGYLSRLLSTRVYFSIAAAGFTLASLLCACAWSLPSMVVFRIIQGFLGGGMMPSSFSAMFLMFPEPERRHTPLLVGGLLTILAPSMGPTFGGYITGVASWHWLFLINLVPGAICVWGVWRNVDHDRPEPGIFARTDWAGLLFLAAFLGGFTYTLDEGPRVDWFDDASVACGAVLAVAGAVLFFWRVSHTDYPIVDLRAFRNRNFAICALISITLGISIFTLNFLTPLFLGRVRDFDSLQIGEVLMVQGCTMFLSAPIAAQMARFLDPRAVITIGVLLVSSGSWLNGHLTVDWGHAQFALPQMLRGLGMILTFIPMTNLALGTLPPEEVKNASGLFMLMRNIGGAIGLAMVTTLLNDQYSEHRLAMVSALTLDRPAVQEYLGQAGALFGGDDAGVSMAVLSNMADQQALTMAYSDMYLLLGILVMFNLLLVPLIAKPRPDLEDVAGH